MKRCVRQNLLLTRGALCEALLVQFEASEPEQFKASSLCTLLEQLR